MKTCKNCKQRLPHSDFYKDATYTGGYRHDCKTCKKIKSVLFRATHLEEVQAYDNKRSKLPHRVKQSRAARTKYAKHSRAKINARNALYRAVDAGLIQKTPCFKCGETEVEAHHDDYSKPLKVKWICRKHHHELHRKYDYGKLV